MDAGATQAPSRPKLTLNWAGKCPPVPDIVFVDAVSPVTLAAAATIRANPEPVSETKSQAMPIPHVVSIREEHKANILRMLDIWSEWSHKPISIANRLPGKCIGAPDARIHSFQDMEIETDRRLIAETDTAVWELVTMEREAVMRHYNINRVGLWLGDFDKLFEMAIESLYKILRERIAC